MQQPSANQRIRACNAFEAHFASHNVRFAVAAYFPPQDRDSVVSKIRSKFLPHPALKYGVSSDNHFFIVRTPPELKEKELEGSLEKSLENLVESSTEDLCLTLLIDQDYVIGLVIDFNHSLCDGRTMQSIISSLYNSLAGFDHLPKEISYDKDWMILVEQSLKNLSTREESPDFLPMTGTPIALKDLAPPVKETTFNSLTGNIHYIPSHEAIQGIRSSLRKAGGSLTGFWVFCLQQAIAKYYFETTNNNDCTISVSVLVDLRPYLPDTSAPAQAFGTITVARTVSRLTLSSDTKLIISGAAEMTSEIRRRISRGEAHRSALALCSGRFHESAPGESTIELSNHGVYDVPKDAKLAITQRYDGYTGVSVIVWSERETNALKIAGSWGNVNGKAVDKIMNYFTEFLERES